MIRRPRRTVPAVVVALVLLAIAVLVAWSCVQVLLGQPPVLPFGDIGATLASLSADQLPVLVAAGVLALIGLLLVGAAAVPGTPTVLALSAPDGDAAVAGTTRRSLVRSLTRAATAVEGVDQATVRLTGRRAGITARTPYRTDQPDLADHVRDAVTARLDDIGLARPVTVAVRVTSRST